MRRTSQLVAFALLASVSARGAEPARPEVRSLMKDLRGGGWEDREQAALNLAALGATAAQAVPQLIHALGDEHVPVFVAAGFALGKVGEPALPHLIAACYHASDPVKVEVARILRRLGPRARPATPALIKLLDSGDVQVREGAASALGRVMLRAEGVPEGQRRVVIEALLKSLDRRGSNPNETFARSAAAMTLGHLGPSAAGSVPDLVRCLQDADARVRTACAWALGGGPLEPTPSRWMAFRNAQGGFAEAGAPALPDLIVALHDVDPSVQWSAAQSLGHLGEAAQPAIAELRALVASELAGESEAARPKPTARVYDPASDARALKAQLTSGAFQARNVTPTPRYIRAASAQQIAPTVAPIQQVNPHESVIQVRLADVMAGVSIPDPAPTPPPKTRQRPDLVLQQSVVRAHAAAALFMLGDTSALDTLTRLLTMNVHPAVRELAAVLLGQSGAGQAVPALSAALNDDDWQVRDAASTALTRIQG